MKEWLQTLTVVQTIVVEDLCASLEPGGLLELDASVLAEELWGEDAQGTEEGPPCVDHLDLTVAGEGLGVSGQTSCVPAVVCTADQIHLAIWPGRGPGESVGIAAPTTALTSGELSLQV